MALLSGNDRLAGLFAVAIGLSAASALAANPQPSPQPSPPSMSAAEVKAFLARPLVAHLAVVRKNGTPQLVPMWFLYRDGAIYMSTRTSAAKLKHIRANPRVEVVVDVMEAPLKNKSVTVAGTAEIQTTGVKEIVTEIYRKYVGEAGLKTEAAQRNIDAPRVILKITPKKITSVDTTR